MDGFISKRLDMFRIVKPAQKDRSKICSWCINKVPETLKPSGKRWDWRGNQTLTQFPSFFSTLQ